MAEADDEKITGVMNDGDCEMMDTSMDPNYKNMSRYSAAMNDGFPSKAFTSKMTEMPELEDQTKVGEENETIFEIEEEEEGEIMDDTSMDADNTNIFRHSTAINKVSSALEAKPIFSTGINIFDKKIQEKLQERAKRFALKPEEINCLNDQVLQDLYDSLGINSSGLKEVKLKTVHLRGYDSMTGKDVVEYFASYAPEGIEWLDGRSCNIVWLDEVSAARALHFLSRPVVGMPARAPIDTFPKEFLNNVADSAADDELYDKEPCEESIPTSLNNSGIANELAKLIKPKKKTYSANAVDIAEISIKIPPGYWRLGIPHPKSRGLLMRFGNLTDKLPVKSEKCDKYYKLLSNSSSQKHYLLATENKEDKISTSIFKNNKRLTQSLSQSKNPWGSLAKNWDKDLKRERDPIMYVKDEVIIPELKNPSLQARLGTKRKSNEDNENLEEIKEKTNNEKKSKVPRMTMYADEEEYKKKEKKILTAIRKQEVELSKNHDDLRNMLSLSKRSTFKKDRLALDPSVDLGLTLKNRIRKINSAVDSEPTEDYNYDLFDNHFEGPHSYSNIRVKVRGRRSPEQSFSESENESSRTKYRSPLLRSSMERDVARRRRRHIRSRSRSPGKRLYSDRLPPRKPTPYRGARSSKSTYDRNKNYSHRNRDRGSGRTRRKHETEYREPKVPSTIWSKVVKPSQSNQNYEESDNSSTSSSDTSESLSDSSDSGSSTYSAGGMTERNSNRTGFRKRRFQRERKWKK